MSNNVESLIDIHTKRVNEHCAKLCEEQMSALAGTQFEEFSRFLKRAWLGFFHTLAMGEAEMLPVICGGAQDNVLKLYSALRSLQFTNRPVPVAIENIEHPVKCCLEWHMLKGDGTCVAKELEFSQTDDATMRLANDINVITKDIFGEWGGDNAPVHFIILACQIVAYHYIYGQVYVGTERNIIHPGHDTPVVKVTFTNGLKTSHIYMDFDRVWDDWSDFTARLNGHMGEDENE